MANCTFPKNPLLTSMVIPKNDDEFFKNIQLKFNAGYSKEYDRVPVEYAYGLFYSKTPATYFNEHIRGKYKNVKI